MVPLRVPFSAILKDFNDYTYKSCELEPPEMPVKSDIVFYNNSSYGGFSCILGLVRAVWLKLKCQRRMIKSQELVIKKPASLCFLSFVEEKRQRDWRAADPV